MAKEENPVQLISTFQKQYGNEVNEWFMHVILLHALGGVGKTRLAYDFCYHLATGTPWNNFHCTAPQRRCLIVQTDESPSDTLRSLEGRGFTGDMPIYIKTKWTIENIARLRKEIENHAIEVVVIDSLTSVNNRAICSENDTEYARPVLELKELAHELGITILLIHHSNAEGRSRGTKAIFNSVSQVLSFKFPSDGSRSSCPDRILCIEKSRFRRPTEYKLRYQVDPETHQWCWVCEGENLQEPDEGATAKDAIMNLLSQHQNTVFEVQEIREQVGGDRCYVGK